MFIFFFTKSADVLYSVTQKVCSFYFKYQTEKIRMYSPKIKSISCVNLTNMCFEFTTGHISCRSIVALMCLSFMCPDVYSKGKYICTKRTEKGFYADPNATL